MDNSFSSIISTANAVLFLLPAKPSLDEVAAALSFYLSIGSAKQAAISSEDPMTVEFNRLVGVNKISPEIGNKNLTIRFVNYNPEGIEKVSYDIENGEFKLTIVPKAGIAAPGNEQVNLSYGGINADLVVLVGGHSVNDFAKLSSPDLTTTKIVHVGVTNLETGGKGIISLASPASSVSERAFKLLSEGNFEIGSDIATNLLAGIEAGSQNFSTRETGADTFATVAALLRAGGERDAVGIEKETLPPGTIPTPPPTPPKSWLGTPKIYKGSDASIA